MHKKYEGEDMVKEKHKLALILNKHIRQRRAFKGYKYNSNEYKKH